MPKTVLITGAGSGFGKGASLALAARGHDVTAATETDEQAAALSAEAPQLTVERIDITTGDVDKVSQWDIDVLINNAGMIAKGSGRVIAMSSIGGLHSYPAFGPYNMTKHALEGMAKAMRIELAPQGIDVCLINPGPHGTGFNDNMIETMWEWFGDNSLQAPNMEMFASMRTTAITDQMDPMAVVDKLVELTEAETTAEHNIVPPEGVEELNEATGLQH